MAEEIPPREMKRFKEEEKEEVAGILTGGYCFSNWHRVERGKDYVIKHHLGEWPKIVQIWFCTDLDDDGHPVGGTYAVTAEGRIDNPCQNGTELGCIVYNATKDELHIRTEKDAVGRDSSDPQLGWRIEGYYRVLIWA